MIKEDKKIKDKILNIITANPNSIFSKLTAEQQKILSEDITYSLYSKGELIYKEGNKPVCLICLYKGKVKVLKEGAGEKTNVIIRMVKPMGFVGYRALFTEENTTSSAVAIEDSITFSISYDLTLKLIENNPKFSIGIIRSLANELGFSNTQTLTLTQKHTRGRLAESLLFLKEIYGTERDGATISVLLSREELANLSNMTTSNAIRTLSMFSKEKIINVRNRKIKILNDIKLNHVSKYE